jgi:hypothetical protein
VDVVVTRWKDTPAGPVPCEWQIWVEALGGWVTVVAKEVEKCLSAN